MTETLSHSHTLFPPKDLEALLDVSRFLEHTDGPAALVGPDGQTVDLPEEAFQLLYAVFAAMREGKAVTIAPLDTLLTTQQAADFLGISRPTLVKKLEDGTIPFERTTGGRHRKVHLIDIVTYQQQQRVEKRKALDALTAEAVADGLYETSSEDYAEALRRARGKQAHG